MTGPEAQDTLRRALMKLAEDGVLAQDRPNPKIEAIRDKLFRIDWPRRVTPVSTAAIGEMFTRTKGIRLLPNRCIELEPRTEGGVAILTQLLIDAAFNEAALEVEIIEIGVVSFFLYEDELKSVSMRFEPPEGKGGGKHDFYHAQFTSSIRRRHPVPGCAHWLPDSELAFPIDADNGMELFIAAIVHVGSATIIPKLARDVPGVRDVASGMKLDIGLTRP